MTPDDIYYLIPQYLAGTLSGEEQQLLESKMAENPELNAEIEKLQQLWSDLGLLDQPQPSLSLRAQFYQNLNAAMRSRQAPVALPWWKRALFPQLAAAALIFVLGLAMGRFPTHSPVQAPTSAPPSEVSELRGQVESLRQTVALSLMGTQSASSRLQGISFSNQIDRPDQELLTALLTTLNRDPDVNIRLAALDALEKFTSDASVRKALEKSIPDQQSPLVQIALIDSLVHIRDRAAASEFKQLSSDTDVNAAVRERARWGLQKLHFE